MESTAFCKGATHGDYSCRIAILGSVTRLTGLSVRVYWPGISPLPAALFEDGGADRAHGRFWRLAFRFIFVMNSLVNQAVHPTRRTILTCVSMMPPRTRRSRSNNVYEITS
jgi:hypothetical protein